LYRFLAVLILLIPVAAGCRGPSWSTHSAKTQARSERRQATSLAVAEAMMPASADAPTEKTQEEAMAEVLDELTEVGAIDPAVKRELMADLREAKPENWSMIVQQFRSALAYRQQLAERELKAASNASKQLASQELSSQILAMQTNFPPSVNAISGNRLLRNAARKIPAAIPVSFDVQETSLPAVRHLPSTATPESSPSANKSVESTTEVKTTQVLAEPPQLIAQQASYLTKVEGPTDRQGHLEAAIADWQASVNPTPGSTEEVNEHLRLRLLQLLAGNEEEALLPVPGATAAQQDYWNKQLFAVSTFLDSKRQPNDKQRAAGSLIHLDQARAKLAELATLQVRKLAFVDSVDGYGAYQLQKKTEFSPGEPVTLYAEIENFSSESTKDGYRTKLGTSYEVVDKNGKRVDSAQFPEVEDLCQNVRRDFHMQYTVTLPTRIYPEDYELRLIITDQLSHKIGQASVPFKIVE